MIRALLLLLAMALVPNAAAYAEVGNCPLTTEWNGVRCVLRGTAHKAQAAQKIDAQAFNGVTKELQNKLVAIENEVNVEDGISDAEVQYIMRRVIEIIKSMFFSSISDKVSDVGSSIGDVKDSLVSKIPLIGDADKELQREIAREVLADAKNQREKDVEKAYDKLSGKIKVLKGGNVPAQVVVAAAQEAKEADFAEGVLIYIEERKKGKSQSNIRYNSSEILSGGFGTFGGGASLSTTSGQATGVLYARYEESYQRYLLAQKFGRTE